MKTLVNLDKMKKINDLQGEVIINPKTNTRQSISEICAYYLIENNFTQKDFIEDLEKALNIINKKALLIALDDGELMAIKRLSKLECLLISDLVKKAKGKLAMLSNNLYINDDEDIDTFADAIHQLLIKNILAKVNYEIAINQQEIDNDNAHFG